MATYDAFISYRHSELDSFVAKTLHKELEAFKLPANLVKQREQGSKTRIERVFRDREELPLASNLSDPINEALEAAEFLLVICTPRLLESKWCMKEIDTFIELHGEGHVLAVLAEGEPRDSFPPQLYRDNKEPLAADVRGNSKAEIKKKIKEEVLRIAAPMFECGYDDIKQRHREEVLKKRMQIFGGIAAAMTVFGCVTAFQSLTIKKQSDKITDQYSKINSQYDEIEKQYNENLKNQAQMLYDKAVDSLEKGDVLDAVNSTIESVNIVKNTHRENYARLVISEAMGVYSTGNEMISAGNIETSGNIVNVQAIGDGKFVVLDNLGNMTIYDINVDESLFVKKKLASFSNVNVGGNFENNKISVADNKLYYTSKYNAVCISLDNYETLWTCKYKEDDKYDIDLYFENKIIGMNDAIAVVNEYYIAIINKEDGQLLSYCDSEKSGYKFYDGCVSADDAYIYVTCDAYDEESESAKTYLAKYNTATAKIDSRKELPEGYYSEKLIFDAANKNVIASCTCLEREGYGFMDSTLTYKMICLDQNLSKYVWQNSSYGSVDKMGINGDKLVAVSEHNLYEINPSTGQKINDYSWDKKIINVITYEDTETYTVLFADGQKATKSGEDGMFIIIDSNSTLEDSLEGYVKIGNYFAAWEFNQYKVHLYCYKKGEGIEEYDGSVDDIVVQYDDEGKTLDNIDVDENDISDVVYDMSNQYVVILFKDATLALYDMSTGEKVDNNFDYLRVDELNGCSDMNDDYFAVDTGVWKYIISRESGDAIARVNTFIGFDKNEDVLVLGRDSNICKTKIYSYDELVEMTK